MAKIYFASKLRHAQKWIALDNSEDFYSHTMTSSWPYLVGKIEDSPENAMVFWRRNTADIVKSDLIICYAEPEDVLRGALVETGVGIACGLSVFCCGTNTGFGTWQYSGNVYRFPSLEQVFWAINHIEGSQ